MRVVVAGGTGFIGRKLVHALVERGDAVIVLTRDPSRARSSFGDARVAIEAWGGGDVAWKKSVAEADAVVSLAGEPVSERWTAERVARMRSSRVDGTTAIADVIAGAPGPMTFVSASAVGIYGMRSDDEVLEEHAPHGSDVLAQICEAWEAAAMRAARPGVRIAIPRIGIVLGRDGGMLAKLRGVFAAGLGGPVGSGRQWLSWIHEGDAVRALLFALEANAIDGAFNVSAPKPVTMNDFAQSLGRAMHRPSIFRVPAFALKLAVGEGMANVALSGQRAVPARLERGGFTFRFETIDAALADLVA